MKTKILILSANPVDTDRLQLSEEVRAIDNALRQGQFRDHYELVSHGAVQIDDLQELLLRYQPEIIHFSGHATKENAILLQDAQGKSVPVSADTLSELFKVVKDQIRCVVLNACYSASQAQAIAQHIDIVIGMSTAISDSIAINFARAFYRALGFGRTIQTAFDLGCKQINPTGNPGAEIPQLLALRSNPARLTLVGPFLRSGTHYVWAILTLVPLLGLLYYLLQILFRWVAIDLAFLAFVANFVQLIGLLLTALGLSTDLGKNAAGALWDTLVYRFPPLRQSRNIFVIMSCLTIVLAIGYYLGSPVLARNYNESGLTALEQKQYMRAVRAFQQASILLPNNGRYYFNVGLAHEAAGEYAEALTAYTQAAKLEADFWPTYNNLGRLHLLPNYQPNPAEALRILETGLDTVTRLENTAMLAPTTALLAKGVLHKNLGWAQLLHDSPDDTLVHLQIAIAALEQLEQQSADKGVSWLYLAESYSLQAQAYEALGNPVEAQRAWGNSEGYALIIPATTLCQATGNAYCIDAKIWADKAAKQFKKLSGGKS